MTVERIPTMRPGIVREENNGGKAVRTEKRDPEVKRTQRDQEEERETAKRENAPKGRAPVEQLRPARTCNWVVGGLEQISCGFAGENLE
jgi:hypothetical protein